MLLRARCLELLCLVVALAWLPAGAQASPAGARTAASMWSRLDDRCEAIAREPFPPYPWPLAPFHRQHPVRGYFGDPRTVFSGQREAALSFHNGIDISAWRGNRVYPVVSGTVIDVDGDRVIVSSAGDRRFQYIHIWPSVHVGQSVRASVSVLGTIPARWSHVHLSEIRSGCVVNPLAQGHLTPFRDTSRPQIKAIYFEDLSGRRLPPSELTGNVRLITTAQDIPAIAAPGQWRRMPVAPALLTWKLATPLGRVVMHGIGADFRFTEPPSTDFCSVYAPGTVQNFAAVAGVYRWARPGRFLYDLTAKPLDTSLLHPGPYLVTVAASNLGGHTTTRIVPIEIDKRRLLHVVPAHPDRRCR